MNFRVFEWDAGNTGHIAQHSVTQEEAEEACSSGPLILRSRHGRYLVLGQTESGRYAERKRYLRR